MKYTPDAEGFFAGQRGYGYLSLESFVDNCLALNAGEVTLQKINDMQLPTLEKTLNVTAILEAGRRSLDSGGGWVDIQELIKSPDRGKPIRFQPTGWGKRYI